jgi:orotidine-5'-phosphate decarboxylase
MDYAVEIATVAEQPRPRSRARAPLGGRRDDRVARAAALVCGRGCTSVPGGVGRAVVTYLEKLRAASAARDSLLCVGLDPDRKLVAGGLEGAVDFCRRVVDATSDVACCYKPNAAFWEQYGPRGWDGLARVKQGIPPDVPALLDAKRADVPNTMAAYAAAIFDAMGFDAATVHAYHGADSLAEFVKYEERGVYVVCHTSNPGREDLQHRASAGAGEPLYLAVAGLAARSGRSGNVGVVVGATAPAEAAAVRAAFPALPFLLPGIGRQGGDLEAAVAAAFTGDPASCLVAVAGAVMYADDPRRAATGWRDRMRRAAHGGR